MTERALTGWGRTIVTVADVAEVAGEESARAAVAGTGARGVIARGLGRSYGDPAQNGGGLVVTLPEGRIALDLERGTCTASAGTSIDALLRVLVPQGFFVPVTPGTRFVTVGGAIAADVHGKNHHVDGSFGSSVERMRVLLSDGTARELTPSTTPSWFWATVGGMGLTGLILDATFRCLPIETSRLAVDTLRTDDVDQVMAAMEEGDERYRYSVAWMDLTVGGARLGRSILQRGDHAPADAVGPGEDALAYDANVLLAAPPFVPGGLLNRLTVRAFNEAWYRKAPRRERTSLESIPAFFHPLDMVGSWNRVYGPAGFLQYQFVVPFGQEAVLRRVIERLVDAGSPSFLTVLKRFGPANPAPLSFPTPGWTLALDVPAAPELGPLFRELDGWVLDAGGRHYLAKDAHATPEVFAKGYPRLAEWQAVRDEMDPERRWCSDQARRLELVTRRA